MRIAKLLSEEKGAVTILTAAALVALIGIAALVTDAGLLYLNEAKIENALDSAVLAGVQELPDNSELAIETALDYALQNGLDPDEVEIELELDQDQGYILTGQATRKVDLFFARVLGFNDTDVSARSRAKISSLSAATGILPFGVFAADYGYGEEISLKTGGGNSFYPGWYGALSLGGNGADVYYNNIVNGYSGKIKIGDIIPLENGVMSNKTKTGVNGRINACKHVPRCTSEKFVEGCPRIIIIPMIKAIGEKPKDVEVVGFAALLLDKVLGQGNECEVTGRFIRYVTSGEGEGINDYGVYTGHLCR